ncbi:MAG: zinc-ribbon domain-containing protein [bacterium]
MVYCSRCGQRNSGGASRCRRCGHRIQREGGRVSLMRTPVANATSAPLAL